MLLFGAISPSYLVTLPLSLHENYGQLSILNTDDAIVISLSTFRLTVIMNSLPKYQLENILTQKFITHRQQNVM